MTFSFPDGYWAEVQINFNGVVFTMSTIINNSKIEHSDFYLQEGLKHLYKLCEAKLFMVQKLKELNK